MRLAHATHMGLTKTKQYLRAKLWWPGLDADVEGLIKGCGVCQALNPDGAEKFTLICLAHCIQGRRSWVLLMNSANGQCCTC